MLLLQRSVMSDTISFLAVKDDLQIANVLEVIKLETEAS